LGVLHEAWQHFTHYRVFQDCWNERWVTPLLFTTFPTDTLDEEFVAGYDRLLSDKDTFLATIGNFTDVFFELSDRDGDGRLSKQDMSRPK
jgi:hypothetical protein